MEYPKTLLAAIEYFSDEQVCIDFVALMKWADGKPTCPNCGDQEPHYLKTQKRWKCHCSRQFSVKVNTIFEDSPIPLQKWLPAMWLLANCKNGINSYEIHRALGVTQKSAWFMLQRIRLAFQNGNLTKMGGKGQVVETDETFIGPDPRKMHNKRRRKFQTGQKAVYEKAIVMGMLDREAREVRAKVIPNVKRETLLREIFSTIEGGSTVCTDQGTGYDSLAHSHFVHETVNHTKEYVRGQVHTQNLDNFWSLLKRGLTGTYVSVEPFHLDRYVTEQAFRYNNRATKDNPLTDGDRFALAVSQIANKRLTYKELTGKVQEPSEPF